MPQLSAYTPSQIAAMGLQARGVRDGSHPTETREVNNNTRAEWWWCDWAERENAIRFFLGDVSTYDEAGTLRLSRLLPVRHPDKPELAAVKLLELKGHKFVGLDENSDPEYEKAELRFQYEHVPFEFLEDAVTDDEQERYVQPLPSQNDASYLNMPGGILKYVRDDGVAAGDPRPHLLPIPYSVGHVIPTSIVKVKWHRLPYSVWRPDSALYARVFGDDDNYPYVGTVNRSAILGRPQGTMLFLGVEEELNRSPIGTGWEWNLTYSWLWKGIGHNWFYWWETDPDQPASNGIYFAARDEPFHTSDTLPDAHALFNARDHNLLFEIG